MNSAAGKASDEVFGRQIENLLPKLFGSICHRYPQIKHTQTEHRRCTFVFKDRNHATNHGAVLPKMTSFLKVQGTPMKAVILAGGLGTRLSEETGIRPKPMVEIGGRPILWHILKIYSQYGINDFMICCGYKGYLIKEYFANYFLHMSDVTFDMRGNHMEVHQSVAEPWRVTLVDTGETTGTGGRLRRVSRYVEGEDAFCMTYGDGVSDVDISATVFHRATESW